MPPTIMVTVGSDAVDADPAGADELEPGPPPAVELAASLAQADRATTAVAATAAIAVRRILRGMDILRFISL